MNALKTIGRNAVLFAIGGTIYYMIELIWRGRLTIKLPKKWDLLLVLRFDK